jgi:cytosine permease
VTLADSDTTAALPPILASEWAGPPLARGPWYFTVAPAYLGLFVWIAFFDPLWISDLQSRPFPWLCASAVGGSILCFALLYVPAAALGFRVGRPLSRVAASAFGTTGSEWITGVGVALGYIVWYAVALDYAVGTVLLGLRSCGLIQAASLAGWSWGPVTIKSPVYLCTALFWIFITGMAGLLRLAGVIAALMRVYAPVALLLLAATAAWFAPEATQFTGHDARLIADLADSPQVSRAATAVDLIFGFFAMAGLMSVDWGGVARRRRDLVLGGIVGVALAASLAAISSLIIVAGGAATVRRAGGELVASVSDPPPLSFRWAVFHGFGGYPGGVILVLFGLASLAPACFAVWGFSKRLSTHWPRLRRWRWTWLGGAAAFVLIGTSAVGNPGAVYCIMGDIFAPAVGAITGHRLGLRREWNSQNVAINSSGLCAWGFGALIALVADATMIWGRPFAGWNAPPALDGFVAALVIAAVLAPLELRRGANAQR